MIALGLLLVFLLYVGAALLTTYGVSHIFKTRKKKVVSTVIFLLVFILIPTWDIVPGRLHFKRLCDTEGGVRVYKRVEGVEGFYTDDQSIIRNALMKYGYKFIEGTPAGGKLTRYSLDSGGKLIEEEINQSTSPYALKTKIIELSKDIQKFEEKVVDTKSNEILVTHTQFGYSGNWVQRKFSPWLGSGGVCSTFPQQAYENLIFSTLKSTKSLN